MDKQTRMRELGRRGGLATVARHGRAHMATIGRLGFQATMDRHWNGDRKAAVRRLQELGLMAQDPFPSNRAWQFEQRPGEPW